MKHSVLLDTSFLVRLLNDEDKFHENALSYYKYFLENDIVLKVVTHFTVSDRIKADACLCRSELY